MRSSIGTVIAVLAVAGCALEHGNPPPEASSTARHGTPRDSANSPLHGIFARQLDTVAPGATRLTVRVVLRSAGGRDSSRAALEVVAADARQRDSTLGAMRVLGYLPPTPGHGEAGSMGLVPFAYLEWVPAEGWDNLTARGARAAHHTEVVFVQDLPSHPGTAGRGGERK
jgi:hypothetical protein